MGEEDEFHFYYAVHNTLPIEIMYQTISIRIPPETKTTTTYATSFVLKCLPL